MKTEIHTGNLNLSQQLKLKHSFGVNGMYITLS